VMPERVLRGIDVAAWHAHGRVTCREAQTAVRRASDEVVRPCLDELKRVTLSGGIVTASARA
jgi:hypothetical protein